MFLRKIPQILWQNTSELSFFFSDGSMAETQLLPVTWWLIYWERSINILVLQHFSCLLCLHVTISQYITTTIFEVKILRDPLFFQYFNP